MNTTMVINVATRSHYLIFNDSRRIIRFREQNKLRDVVGALADDGIVTHVDRIEV